MLLRRAIPAAILVVGLALLAPACTEDMLDAENDLVVLNDSACDVVVFVDGREAFTVKAGSDRTLDDIGTGRHVLEAINDGGKLVERHSIELAGGEDYYWIVNDC